MATIRLNAFSFLQAKLKKRGIPCVNEPVTITENQCVRDLLRKFGIDEAETEGAFVNGKISPINTVLKDGDRVGLLPPGTPGPYRLLLGMVNMQDKQKKEL